MRAGLRLTFVSISLVLLVATASTADARVPGRGARQRLSSAVAAPLEDGPARGALAGLIVQREGRPVVELNATAPMTPASLAKLATTTAALIRFGPSHRFATRIVGPKPVDGVVHGSITLVGGGDPAFSTRAFVAENFVPKPDDPAPVELFGGAPATVEDLAAALANAGVNRVTGNLRVDESLFDAVRTMPGWLPEYQKAGDAEVGNLSAATINLGFADLKATTIAQSPATETGGALRSALWSAGVRIGGRVEQAAAPRSALELARVNGPALTDIVFWTNRFSVNYAAEILLKDLGASVGGAGTAPAGITVVHDTLARAGIPLDGFHMEDGSGLSLLDMLTPATIAALIGYALADRTGVGDALRASFPVAGEAGTLAKRMRSAPAAGNLRGKTGLVRGVRAMAGWVRAEDGSTIVYVSIFNRAADARRLTGPLDLIGLTLARFPYV